MTQEPMQQHALSLRAAVTARVAGLGLALKTAVQAYLIRRRAMADLAAMDERMLSDIGLTGGDIRSALAEPLWSDPTLRLNSLAAERRFAARAQAEELLSRTQDEGDPEPEPLRIAC